MSGFPKKMLLVQTNLRLKNDTLLSGKLPEVPECKDSDHAGIPNIARGRHYLSGFQAFPDKRAVYRGVFRVLKSGGIFRKGLEYGYFFLYFVFLPPPS